jgi:hypothetical protein
MIVVTLEAYGHAQDPNAKLSPAPPRERVYDSVNKGLSSRNRSLVG